MLKRLFAPTTLLFLAIWLVLLVGGRERFLRDAGMFWHTVVGERMLQRGEIMRQDEFSFTCHGDRWLPSQWLGEIGFALLNRIGQLDALLVFTTAILALVFAWLGGRLMRTGWHWLPASLTVFFTVAAAASHFHLRPHIATIAFMAVVFALLTDFEAGRIGVGRLLWLVPIMLIWSNIHGGALAGLGTCVIALGGWVIWSSSICKLSTFAKIVGIGLLSGAVMLINPFGTDIVRVWLDIMGASELRHVIKEHATIDLSEPTAWIYVCFGLFYIVMLAGVRGRMRVMWLMPLLWFAMGCDRVRHGPLFAVGALVALADFFPFTTYAARIQRRGSDLFIPPTEPVRWSWWGVLVPVLCVSIALGTLRGWARLDAKLWPVALHQELLDHQNDRPSGTRIFNEFLWGGYLIYYAPGYRVFIDDRCELYRYAWLAEFVEARDRDTTEAIRAWEAKYGAFDMALVETEKGFDRHFATSSEWKVIRRANTATLYGRTSNQR